MSSKQSGYNLISGGGFLAPDIVHNNDDYVCMVLFVA